MKTRAKSKFRRTAEVAVLLSVTAVSAVLFRHHQAADKVDEAALKKTEAMVQGVAERSEDLVKNGPKYFVDGLKHAYNPSESVKYNRIIALNLILEKDPDNLSALEKRARLLAQLELYEEALADLDHLIELRPNDGINYYRRAWIFVEHEMWEEARPDLERFLAADPDESGSAKNTYAYVLARLGEFEKALPLVKESLAAGKESHNLDTLGYVLVGLERYEEAVGVYTDALELDPENTYALRGRAVAYRALGEEEKSLADLSTLSALDPDFCLHWENDVDPGEHDDENKGVLTGAMP